MPALTGGLWAEPDCPALLLPPLHWLRPRPPQLLRQGGWQSRYASSLLRSLLLLLSLLLGLAAAAAAAADIEHRTVQLRVRHASQAEAMWTLTHGLCSLQRPQQQWRQPEVQGPARTHAVAVAAGSAAAAAASAVAAAVAAAGVATSMPEVSLHARRESALEKRRQQRGSESRVHGGKLVALDSPSSTTAAAAAAAVAAVADAAAAAAVLPVLLVVPPEVPAQSVMPHVHLQTCKPPGHGPQLLM
mmetsp:Transcript_170690/g.547513  ORF Transcript_170690/g.547513 Transcript_170690/m.547513 type:complete len:245 (-) Transcript_170690:3716-4450(-)